MKLSAAYEKSSVRSARAWAEAAAPLGVHPVILREFYFDKYCRGVQRRDFFSLLKRGGIKPTAEDLATTMTPEEIEAKALAQQKANEENDSCDLLLWRLKQLVEVGDEVMSDETKTFTFSQAQYITQGKRYKITELKDDGGSEFGFISDTDIEGERNWGSAYGIKSLWRNGVEIYNWNLAYLELFKEENPDHEQTQIMIEHCTRQAELSRKGEKE
jgi:hypothetical protein